MNSRNYKVVLVLDPNLKEKETEKVFEEVKMQLEKQKGVELKAKKYEGKKVLVYKIGEFLKADFWEFAVESKDGLKLRELNLFLERKKEIIRYLILKSF